MGAIYTRLLIGAAVSLVGFVLAKRFLQFNLFQLPYFIEYIVAAILGGTAVFLVPIVTTWFTRMTRQFARGVAVEIIKQLRLPAMLERIERPSFPSRGDKQKYLNPMILDTSAIIDGRLANIADSGFLFGTLLVPRFVLAELQHIADSEETLRRNRGRRGFEILDSLKKNKLIRFEVVDEKNDSTKNVDDRIVRLARKLNAKIITTDFNLNKVASTMGVKILNVNELVNVIKAPMLPGEPIEVKVIQEGKEKDQGVGYLPDGTMIVVENGAPYLGEKIEAVVSRVLQTVAGRMIFVKAHEETHKKKTLTS